MNVLYKVLLKNYLNECNIHSYISFCSDLYIWKVSNICFYIRHIIFMLIWYYYFILIYAHWFYAEIQCIAICYNAFKHS